ncbi:MAG: hypothetical protein KTR25_09685, partial [Myxococcales bacterium]|nr:hypothetical protein [Myxococcales bacterium]
MSPANFKINCGFSGFTASGHSGVSVNSGCGYAFVRRPPLREGTEDVPNQGGPSHPTLENMVTK